MNYIFSIISPRSSQPSLPKLADRIVSVLQIQNPKQLKFHFLDQLNSRLPKNCSERLMLRSLVWKCKRLNNVHSIIKISTVIQSYIYYCDYEEEVIRELDEVCFSSSKIQNDGLDALTNEILDFVTKYTKYLTKLPSLHMTYQRARFFKEEKSHPWAKTHQSRPEYLTDLFLILNQLNLIVNAASKLTIVMGRYYKQKTPYYSYFHFVLSREVFMLYEYLKFIVEDIVANCKEYQTDELEGFISSTTNIEVFVDKVQDLLLSKYYARGKIEETEKIYLEPQSIEKVKYYVSSKKMKIVKLDNEKPTNLRKYRSLQKLNRALKIS